MALSRIRATVTVTAPVASVTVSASGRLGATAGVTKAAVTKVVPVAAIKWINIIYGAEVDYVGRNPVVRDVTVTLDSAGLHFFKSAFDTGAMLDENTIVFVRKTPDEPLNAIDQLGYDLSRSISDEVDATDDLFGEANIDDDQVMFLSKALQPDHFLVADNLEYIDFGKGLTENLPTQDEINSFDVSKPLDDTPAATEQHGYHLERSLADTADAGDELNAQFVTDDGQVTLVAKDIPTHNQFASDEINSLDTEKALDDAATMSDDQDFDVSKALEDTPQTSEETVYSASKPLADSASTSDSPAVLSEKALTDDFVASDDEILEFGKSALDSASATDELQPFVLGKGIVDEPQTSEQLDFDTSKPLTDSASAAEQHGILTARPVSDTFNAQREGPNLIEDYVTLGYFASQYVGNGGPGWSMQKPFAESQSVSDTTVVVAQYVREFDESKAVVDVKTAHLDKPAADTAATAETVVDEFGKARDDSVSTAETQTVDTTKQFSELLDATDDVFAEANTDDEQVMLFGATKADHATTSETKAFDTSKALDDTGSTSEDLGVDTSKPLTDSFGTADSESTLVAKPASSDASTSDADTISVGKGLADDPSTSDLATRSVGAAREDSIGSSDVLDKLFSRVLTDSWTVSDSSIQVFGKAASDTATSSESKTFDISKAVTDVVDATDDFDGTATAEDDQIMRFVTTRSEIVATSDAHVPLVGKGLADSADTDDSGSLRMTDYCDVNYFTAAYVGTSLTF